MQLLLPPEVVRRLKTALASAGRREVGGVLMGECIDENTIRVEDLTIQMKGGTFASFVRLVEGFLTSLRAFFQAKGHRYTRFNYVGEWHSHHSFELRPSNKDHRTMYRMVDDSSLGAYFVALLLVRVGEDAGLEGAVTVYLPASDYLTGEVVQEQSQE